MSDLQKMQKIAYEQNRENTGRQLYDFLYPNKYDSTAVEVDVDAITGGGITSASSVLDNQPSPSGSLAETVRHKYQPSRISKKVIIDETVRNMVAAGLENNVAGSVQVAEHVDRAIREQMVAINTEKNKMALELLTSGKFISRNEEGNTIGEYDNGRKAGSSYTYNFATGGHTFSKALDVALKNIRNAGGGGMELGAILGSEWVAYLGLDTDLNESKKGNQWMNEFNVQYRTLGIDGLGFIGTVKPSGHYQWINLFSYHPTNAYNRAGTVSPYIPTGNMVLFPMNSNSGYRFNMGVDVVQDGRVVRTTGEAVVDTISQFDPTIQYFRAQARPFFLWGNPDFTASITKA